MKEREKRYKSKGGRLNQRLQTDLGMQPGKKAQAPDPKQLLEEFRDLTNPTDKDIEIGNSRMWHRKQSKRRRR